MSWKCFFERWYPFLFAKMFFLGALLPPPREIAFPFGAYFCVASVCALVLLSFWHALYAGAIADLPRITGLRQSGAWEMLERYFFRSFEWCLVLVITGLAVALCPASPLFPALAIGVAAGTLAALCRVIGLVERVCDVLQAGLSFSCDMEKDASNPEESALFRRTIDRIIEKINGQSAMPDKTGEGK